MKSKSLDFNGRTYNVFDDGKIIGPSGKELKWHYDKDGYPAIYSNLEGHSKEDLDKDSVIAIYTEVKDYFTLAKDSMTESMKNMHGVAVHDLQSLADFKIGFVYQLLCHPHSGGVEIVRE